MLWYGMRCGRIREASMGRGYFQSCYSGITIEKFSSRNQTPTALNTKTFISRVVKNSPSFFPYLLLQQTVLAQRPLFKKLQNPY